MDQRKLGNLALVAVAFAWGTMIPVISHLAQTWDPFFLGAVRYVCGVPLLYAALWLAEGFARPAVRPAMWRALVPGWFGLGAFAFIYTIGVAHSNPVIAAVLGAANPVIAAAVGGAIFRIPFDRRLTPAVVLAVAGCALASAISKRSTAPGNCSRKRRTLMTLMGCPSRVSSSGGRRR